MTIHEHLTVFVETHPEGWSHDEWIGLLRALEQDGQDVSNPETVGLALENERLQTEIRSKAVSGLGAKRTQAVVDRFGTLWSLRQASVDDLAEIPSIHRGLAEKLVAAL